ncbi:aftiphilin [Carassius carassius]|uniref:aftiphilin n=1 Tax=Carassius carassius TaxID=217509 RepID=UPI0028696E98|nr:aftiphilin [Carassius carassius]
MEPNVIRLYSSSPPPLDAAGEEEEEDEFGEFGGFDGGGVSTSFSFSELDTPTTFNQSNALEDSPPDLYIKSVQNVTVSGSGWDNDKKMEEESIHNVEKTEKESCDILTDGMTSSDLQMEISVEYGQKSPSIIPDVQNSCMGDRHSLSNGYSESCANSEMHSALSTCLQSTDTEEHSGLDVNIADVFDRKQLINQTDNLPDSNSQSLHEEESEPGETETRLELSGDSQSFTSSRHAKEAEGEQDQIENFIVCGDAGCLDRSADSVDIAETEKDPSMDVDLISDTQLSRDTREINGSSVKAAVEVNEEIETNIDPTADEDFGNFRDATQGFADFSRTESITQDGFPEFVTAMSRCSTDDEFDDMDSLKDFKDDLELAEETTDNEVAFCSELPPSDSFADFSSAPFGGVAVGEEDNWAAFGPPEVTEEGQGSWATFGNEQSTYLGKEEQDVETSAAPSSDNLQSSTADFSCKTQHLFRTAFPSDIPPEVNGVTEVLPLHKFLQAQDPQEQRDPSSSFAQENALAMWRHLQDIHGTHGLNTQTCGVDPEIYELTTAKMENNATGRYIADAFTKLMESMERTRTTARKPEKDEKISKEAAKVISLLPDLSFMQARVLMFPSILTPATNHI